MDELAVSRPARRFAVALLIVVLIAAAASIRHREHSFGLLLAAVIAVVLMVRGLHLGRPITVAHTLAAGALLAFSTVLELAGWNVPPLVLFAASGAVLVLPIGSKPSPERFLAMAALVDRTSGDPLAPFALHSQKSYFVTADGTAGVAYRTLMGIAVVGGDPVGPVDRLPAAVAEFEAYCLARGWRIAVLGAGERGRELWRATRVLRRPVAVAFGRDVVVDVPNFSMSGRAFRNLRQSVHRAANAGVRAEIVAEQFLPAALQAELSEVMVASGHGRQRGYSMILDRPLSGTTPGIHLAIARDATGRVVAFQRYASADHGREISLDVPWRIPGAPNGVDENLTVAMIEWASARGGQRLSLALAAFPELFDSDRRGWRRLAYTLVHLGDGLIAVESLYAYLKKFHAIAGRRFVLFNPWTSVLAVSAFFLLEFKRHKA